jgi:hypothetical protein
MGLFGAKKRRLDGLLDGMDPNMPPFYPQGTPIHDSSEAQQEYDPSGDASPGPKPKFFGNGGVGRGIAGTIGDYLLQMNHMAPIYQQAVDHQRNVAAIAAQREADRAGEMSQYKAKHEYDVANPDPVAPTELEKNVAYLRSIDMNDIADAALAKAGAMSGTNAAGQPVVMNPSSLFPRQGQQAAPPGHMTDEQIAEMERQQGGAGSQAPRGFLGRRRY